MSNWFKLNTSTKTYSKITICNNSGQAIYKSDQEFITDKFLFNLGSYQAGIYYITVYDKEGIMQSAKIIKK